MTPVLSAKYFHDEAAAYAYLEARVWAKGRVCPHCGVVERSSKMAGKSTRIGVYKCYACRRQFTVKVGTVFEASHVPLNIWLQAVALLTASKKGISSNQLHRTLGVTLKTAWFMSHRIREAMRDGVLAPMGGGGSIVEADETYLWATKEPKISKQRKGRPVTKSGRSGPANKRAIISLVERHGSVRSYHVEHADKATVQKIVTENIARETRLHTDESRIYNDAEEHVLAHETVHHSSREYVRDDIHTNSVEGYFSIFQRGMKEISNSVPRSTCTAIWRSSTSAITIAWPWASTMASAPTARLWASSASASLIKRLTSEAIQWRRSPKLAALRAARLNRNPSGS